MTYITAVSTKENKNKKMKNIFLTILIISSTYNLMSGQTYATNFVEDDCNGVTHDLFDELDNGNVIVISWVMPCGPCATYSFPAYDAVQSFSTSHPGKVHFYIADDYANSACGLLNNFANNYSMSNSTIFTSPNITMSDYGVDGMPKVVVLAGSDHLVYLNKNDDKINYADVHGTISNALADGISSINDLKTNTSKISTLKVFPSPASNNITLSYNLQKQDIINIQLVDIFGKQTIIIKDQIQQLGTNYIDINTEKYSSGNYFLKISSEESHQTINFIIEK